VLRYVRTPWTRERDHTGQAHLLLVPQQAGIETELGSEAEQPPGTGLVVLGGGLGQFSVHSQRLHRHPHRATT
jgi:hypothetical protein